MSATPISDENLLSHDSPPKNERDWEVWAYKVGLMLDGIIPLLNLTNAQRIEIAVKSLREREKEHAREIAQLQQFHNDELRELDDNRD